MIYFCIGLVVWWNEAQPATWEAPMSFLLEYGGDAGVECYDDIGGSAWGRSMPSGPWHVLDPEMPQFSFDAEPGPYREVLLPIKLSETLYAPNGTAWQCVEIFNGNHWEFGGDPTTALSDPPMVLEYYFIKISGINIQIESCPADLTGDNTVGIEDLLLMLGLWGDPFDIADFLHLLAEWGGCEYD